MSDGLPLGADVRCTLSFTQCETFLTLVEEGSVTRASAVLDLGPSTVSSHVKAVEDELGTKLFVRTQGGMLATGEGQRVYRRLRGLLDRATAQWRGFDIAGVSVPGTLPVSLPKGIAGTPLNRFWSAFAAERQASHPELGLCCDDGAGVQAELAYRRREPGDARTVLDGWLLVQAGTLSGRRSDPVPVGSLAGRRLLLPPLPVALADLAASFAAQADFVLQHTDLDVLALLEDAGGFNGFCMLLPVGMVPLTQIGRPFHWTPVEAGKFDPAPRLSCQAFPTLAHDFARFLGDAGGELGPLATLPDRRPRPAMDDILSLKHSRSFVALYEEGNVGRAAKRLCVVQPAITMQLRLIEEHLGCRLFERTTRGVTALPAAHQLYRLLHPLVQDVDAAIGDLRRPAQAAPAKVRVGLMPSIDEESLTTEHFVRALGKWQEAHGEKVQVVEAFSGELVRWLQLRQIDFAVVDRRFSDPLLGIEPVMEDSLVVVVGAGSALLPDGSVGLAQLKALPLVLPSERHGLRDLVTRHLAAHGMVVEPRVEVDSMAAALSMVRTGRFATILPMGAIEKSRVRRHLSIHEISHPRITRQICLVRRLNTPCSQPVLDLINEVRLAFGGSAAAELCL